MVYSGLYKTNNRTFEVAFKTYHSDTMDDFDTEKNFLLDTEKKLDSAFLLKFFGIVTIDSSE